MVTNSHGQTYRRVRCPYCRRVNDGHIGSHRDRSPAVGDVSICWNCHAIAVFDHNLHGVMDVRIPTDSEWENIKHSTTVRRARAAMMESTSILEVAGLYRHMTLMDDQAPAQDPNGPSAA